VAARLQFKVAAPWGRVDENEKSFGHSDSGIAIAALQKTPKSVDLFPETLK
jgi:hypothetical protein